MIEKTKLDIDKFITEDLFAPFGVETDGDYYDDLFQKFKLLIQKVNEMGASEKSLKVVKHYTDKVREAIRSYYNGNITRSHTIVKNLLKGCLDNQLAVSSINDCTAFHGSPKTEIQFFRARTSEEVRTFKSKEMLHLPLNLRGLTGNYRFSIPGIPSLYLGNSSYSCWVELGRPAEHNFNVSPVVLDKSQRILNLAVMTRDIKYLDVSNEERLNCWLKLLILMIATSYAVKEKGRIFKSEYIISQSIMLASKELKLDGVAYFSKRVDDEIFSFASVNIALFALYKHPNKYSTICEHIKIDDSFNYSMYKQLGLEYKNSRYSLRVDSAEVINNIGNYKRQYNYRDTEFHSFDKFLFSNWVEKDDIEWGNATKDI